MGRGSFSHASIVFVCLHTCSFASFYWLESEKQSTGQQMLSERTPQKRDKVGGSVVRRAMKNKGKKIKEKSAECKLSEAAAQLNRAGPGPLKRNGGSLNAN